MKTKTLRGDEAHALWKKILKRALVPHMEGIAKAWYSGLIPMAFDVEGTPSKYRRPWKVFRWKKNHRVLAVRREAIDHIMQQPAERRWLYTQPSETDRAVLLGPIHVLLWSGMGCILLVWTQKDGWKEAPGTSDAEMEN